MLLIAQNIMIPNKRAFDKVSRPTPPTPSSPKILSPWES
jgi:hypothetical protein